MQKYIPNYPLNLIDVGNIENENQFQTDLQVIFGMLKYRGKKNELREYINTHKDYFEKVDMETYLAMRALRHNSVRIILRNTEFQGVPL